MVGQFRNTLLRFKRDEEGAILLMFALLLAIMLMVCGLAVDFGRAYQAKSRISASLDAAALAAAKGLRLQNLTDAEVVNAAKTMFLENYFSATGGSASLGGGGSGAGSGTPSVSSGRKAGAYAEITNIDVTIDRDKSAVTIDVDAKFKTLFGAFAGMSNFKLNNKGAAIFEADDLEVALQLDVTGSMGGSKIADLKLATKDLVDILIPDGPQGNTVRIGLAPFAAGVNAGTYAENINGNAGAPDNCVYERLNTAYQDTDNHPSGQSVLKSKVDLPSAASCPNAEVLPMTDNKTLLTSTVDSYTTGGCTAGHLGTAWAWYLLAPSWSSIWPTDSAPVAYGTTGVRKVAILMTDGEYNIVGGSGGCGQVTTSSNFATDTCDEMKSKDIVVYTVGFKLNKASAKTVMSDCATGAGFAYTADNGEELRQVFRDIAENIVRLRLSS